MLHRLPILVAAQFKVWECGRSLAGIVGLKPVGGLKFFSCGCCVLSSRVLCYWPITCTEGSYRMRCVSECDQGSQWKGRDATKDVDT